MLDFIGAVLEAVLLALPIVMMLVAIFIPRKEGYVYNSLDRKGVVFNKVLSCVYAVIPILTSFVAVVFSMMLSDQDGYTPTSITDAIVGGFILNLLESVAMALSIIAIVFAILFAYISILSISISVIARKRGKSKLSFIIQFAPVVLSAICVGTILISSI